MTEGTFNCFQRRDFERQTVVSLDGSGCSPHCHPGTCIVRMMDILDGRDGIRNRILSVNSLETLWITGVTTLEMVVPAFFFALFVVSLLVNTVKLERSSECTSSNLAARS